MVEIILGGLSLQVSSSGWFISTDSKLRSDYYIDLISAFDWNLTHNFTDFF